MRLTAEPVSASAARKFVARTLDAWGRPEVSETATLLTSELVGNVVRHCHTDMLLAVRLRDDCIEVEVADRNPDPVTLRETPVDAVAGRGLLLVDALAARWGVRSAPPGKSVWFELPIAR